MRTTFSIPLLFVFLWSTGYIGFKLCAGYAEPATFVLLRVSITAVLLVAIVKFQKLKWPDRMMDVVHSSIVGILIHGVYAGGVFAALYHGVDAGLCALILGMQPLVTTAASGLWLNESITWMKSTGILIGFVGVAILLIHGEGGLAQGALESSKGITDNLHTLGIFLCFIALLAISIGMIYQKRFCTRTELLPGACIQYTAAAAFMFPFAVTMETMRIDWSWSFVLGLSWLILFLSIGAVSLLMVLIRHGEAGSVSNLFYLVPPLVAIEAWVLFDEQLNLASVIAMILCMSGVILVGYATRQPSVAEGRTNATTGVTYT